jgi:PAS domain S-box-containing protein
LEQLETVFDNMFDGVFILDVSMGEIVYANQAMCTMNGYPRSETLQLTIQELRQPTILILQTEPKDFDPAQRRRIK